MTMQNEPQLSAEMKKRFNEALKGIVYVRKYKSTYKYSQDDDGIEIDLTEEVNGLKHFLATALEEQRKQVLDEVEKLVGDIYDGSDWHTGRHALVDELRTKLNQLKGTEWVGVFAPNGGHDLNNPYPLKRKE